MDLADIKRLAKKPNEEQPLTGIDWLDNLYQRHPRSYYAFLYHLTKKLNPQLIIEIGVQTGVATAHMAMAAPKADVIGIDPNPVWYKDIIKTNCPNVIFIQGYSQNFDHRALDIKSYKIDLAFIDGEHTYEQVKSDYYQLLPHVRKGGVIIIDDIRLPDELEPENRMSEFWDEIKEKKVEINHLHDISGFGAVIV